LPFELNGLIKLIFRGQCGQRYKSFVLVINQSYFSKNRFLAKYQFATKLKTNFHFIFYQKHQNISLFY